MSQFDAAAPMIAAFGDTPNLTPYDLLQPEQSLSEVNPKDAHRARDAMALALDRPGEADAHPLQDD